MGADRVPLTVLPVHDEVHAEIARLRMALAAALVDADCLRRELDRFRAQSTVLVRSLAGEAEPIRPSAT